MPVDVTAGSVGEARASQGLAPMGDTRDALTITELDAQIAAAREVAVAAQQIAAAASSMAQSGSTGWAAIRDLSSGLSALRPMEVGY